MSETSALRTEWVPFNPEYSPRGTLVLPGMQLELKSGKRVLVGHVNDLLGVCDDCTEFNRTDIIRYRVLLPDIVSDALREN